MRGRLLQTKQTIRTKTSETIFVRTKKVKFTESVPAKHKADIKSAARTGFSIFFDLSLTAQVYDSILLSSFLPGLFSFTSLATGA
jgi:hypothetical protein